jgi:predicted glycosyltransferase
MASVSLTQKLNSILSELDLAKIWIDLDNSPHIPFFAPIIKELERRGHSVTLTARDAFQVRELADLWGLTYKRIGRHYGKHTILKVYGSCLRALQLLPTTLGAKPDLALSHGSRSQLLAAALRGIPSIVIFDYEFAKHLDATWIMVPDVIPDTAIHADKSRVLRYPGIKEDVYVPSFTPSSLIRAQLGLNGNRVVVILRPPADEAHYRNAESDALFSATMDFLGRAPETKAVVLPRNSKQEHSIRARWPELFDARKVIIPERAVNGLNLIWNSDLVISGGGTMNREAAALGVPVYSIFRGKIGAVDRYLAEQGRLVLIESVKDIPQKIALVRRPIMDQIDLRAKTALNTIINHILRVCGSKQDGGEPRDYAA